MVLVDGITLMCNDLQVGVSHISCYCYGFWFWASMFVSYGGLLIFLATVLIYCNCT